ncbi:hypothetical protein HDF23_001490 [Mucilaginibacter lappiensis]|uniref:Uncharacterized protein n=1 Tax=Mucilaginibacter lappiensis TaxID=354630 RepID=A0ABR6PG67_9SPHI|nr:hypothetical protein [Mucilaginibacter lappiensis]
MFFNSSIDLKRHFTNKPDKYLKSHGTNTIRAIVSIFSAYMGFYRQNHPAYRLVSAANQFFIGSFCLS